MAKLSVKLYNQEGKENGSVDLNPDIFGVAINEVLLHQVVVAHLANSRYNFAHTKQRGDVSGGGKKPWKQKGTGRARHGSSRSPIWSGGGVTFGPTKEVNFSKGINKKMRRQGLFMSLSGKVLDSELIILEKLDLADIKTKKIKEVFDKLPCEKKILLVVDKVDEKIIKSANNLPKVKVILADSLNAYDVLNADYVVTLKSSLDVIEKTYLAKKKVETTKEDVKQEKVEDKKIESNDKKDDSQKKLSKAKK